ncbi:MAG: hypothetical protein HKN47_19780, partial [Pirellulaceae bacterium]|nr:hypothetical protein [Pirellulaceae bacterium]
VPWNNMVDQVVVVDGLAWGAKHKGLGSHLVLTEGKVYLRNIDLREYDSNGRLLRITGTLRKAQMAKAPPGVQGYTESFDYFFIDAIDVQRIENVTRDQLLRSPHDWIVPGMQIGQALEMIRARQMQTYGLALAAAPDGAKTHCYRVSDDTAVVLHELNQRVQSVAKVEGSFTTKSDQNWTALPGYKLPDRPPRKSK